MKRCDRCDCESKVLLRAHAKRLCVLCVRILNRELAQLVKAA